MSADARWHVGIVGCGKVAGGWDRPISEGPVDSHAQAYRRHHGFSLDAAVDVDEQALTEFQSAWTVPVGYKSVSDMCREIRLDVISVCSPDELHFDHALEALSSPNPPRVLFLEKPACVKQSQLDHLIELADISRTSVVVNHTRRFDPAHVRLANMLRSGLLGNLVQGSWTYYGGWLHNGTHAVDTLALLIDDVPHVISAEVAGYARPTDPDLNVCLTVGNGTVIIDAFDESYYQLFQGELRFDKGVVKLANFGKTIEIEMRDVNTLGERVLNRLPNSPINAMTKPLYHAVTAIGEHLSGGLDFTRVGVDLTTAANTMRVMWSAQDLALSNEVITNA